MSCMTSCCEWDPLCFFRFQRTFGILVKSTTPIAVSFFLLELTYLDLNNGFDMNIIFTTNYFLRTDVLIDSETLLITESTARYS
jgi:hypothetical protein